MVRMKLEPIANSSSTAFMFIVKKAEVENLFKLLRKNGVKFELRHHNMGWDDTESIYKCTVDDVIDALSSLAMSPKPIQEIIDDYMKNLTYYEEEIKKHGRDRWYGSYARELKMKIAKLLQAKDNGFNYIFTVGFGDNHGDISGEGLGSAMDYEGRDISINTKELILITEQDR